MNAISTNDKKLESYSTREYTKKKNLPDISPIFIDFLLNSDKSIFKAALPTGCGKSYGYRKMVEKVLKSVDSEDYVKKMFYLCDTNKNVDDAYKDFIKNNSNKKEQTIRVYNNIKSVEENEAAFKRIGYPFNTWKSYKEICGWLDKKRGAGKKFFNLYVKDTYEENMNKLVPAFQEKLREHFKEIKKEKGLNADSLLSYIEKDNNLNNLLEVFPIMRFRKSKIIFMTIDKAMLPINTIIDKKRIQIFNDKDVVNKSVYFFDEADFLSDKMAQTLSNNGAKMDVNIIDLFRSFEEFENFTMNQSWMEKVKKDELKKQINGVSEKIKNVRKKYFINQRTLIKNEDDNLFLFCTLETVICLDRNRELYFMQDGEDIVIRSKNENEDVSKCVTVNELASEIKDIYYEIFELFRKFCNAYKKSLGDSYSFLDACKRFVSRFFGSGYSKEAKDVIATYIDHCKRFTSGKSSDADFYDYPGIILKISQESDGLGVEIKAYELYSTPEKILKTICEKGGKVFLSSATINNKSVYRNFNLSWKHLENKIYEQSDLQNFLEQKYIKNCDKNGDKVNYTVLKTLSATEQLKNAIINYFDEDKEEIEDLLSEARRKMLISSKFSDDSDNANNDEDDESKEYYYREMLKMINAIITFYEKRTHLALGFTKFLLKNNEHMEKCINDVVEIINRRPEKIKLETCSADNIDDVLYETQKDVLKYRTSIVFTAYATAEKGINPHYEWKGKDLSDIVAINNFGEDKLNKNKKIKVDIDGLYLGPITYVLGYSGDDKESKRLNAMYHYNSLKANGEIDDKEYARVMSKLGQLNFDKNSPFKTEKEKNMISFTHKKFATIQQCVGRMFRSDTRHKNACIIINDSIVNNDSLTVDDVYEDGIDYLQSGMQKVLNAIFENKFDEEVSDEVERKDVRAITAYAANIVLQKLKNVQTNTSDYKEFRQKVKHLFISKEELNNLRRSPNLIEKDLSSMYVPSFEKGYKYIEVKKNGMSCADYIYPLHVNHGNYKTVSKKSTNIYKYDKETKNHLLEKGFSFDPPDTKDYYVLSPEGFSILLGNIGEAITEMYCEATLPYKLSDLPDPIYEVADFVIEDELENNLIFAIDAKYYNDSNHEEYDDLKENCEIFYEKANRMKKFYDNKYNKNVQVVYVVLNTQITSTNYTKRLRYQKDDLILRPIQQIFNGNKFNGSLSQRIESEKERRKTNA